MSGKLVRRAAAVRLCLCLSVNAADWLTFAHDPQRSGWASGEKDLSPETVAGLELTWKSKVKNEPRALHGTDGTARRRRRGRGLAIADGRVHAVDYSSRVYSFGLRDKQFRK
ncbi:MAG TPA: hypothetical protein VFC61_09550 [Blastocatellia bacterium]|nr:hypothetical protein [Blastocatellia bacterium]